MISPTPLRWVPADLLRQTGPVLILGAGVAGGTIWSAATWTPLPTTPPLLLSQGALALAALVVVARGAPSWGYPWLAFGVGGAHSVLHAALLPGPEQASALPSAPVLAIALLAGLVLAMLLAALIAARSWAAAAFFIGLYLVSTGVGLPSLYQAAGSPVLAIEVARLALLVLQVVATGTALVAWNRRAHDLALGILAALLAAAPLALGLLLPRSGVELPPDFSLPWFLFDFGRLYLVVAFFTFGAGAVRRVLGGQGILTGRTSRG